MLASGVFEPRAAEGAGSFQPDLLLVESPRDFEIFHRDGGYRLRVSEHRILLMS